MSKKDFILDGVRKGFYKEPPIDPVSETRLQLCRIYPDGKPLQPVSVFQRPMQILCSENFQDLIPSEKFIKENNRQVNTDFMVVLLDLRYPKETLKQEIDTVLSKIKKSLDEKKEIVAAVFLENYLQTGTEQAAKDKTAAWLKEYAGVEIERGKDDDCFSGLNEYIKYLKGKHGVKDLRELKRKFKPRGVE